MNSGVVGRCTMFRKYTNFLRRSNCQIICVQCHNPIDVKEYQKHLRQQHGIATAQICEWCCKTLFKSNNSANDRYEHRYKCMLDRIQAGQVSSDPICADECRVVTPNNSTCIADAAADEMHMAPEQGCQSDEEYIVASTWPPAIIRTTRPWTIGGSVIR